MRSHLRSMAKRKVSDFLLREEGMVGNRSAFATAALVSTTALAMVLLVSPDAAAHHTKPCQGANAGNYCWINQFCCFDPCTNSNYCSSTGGANCN